MAFLKATARIAVALFLGAVLLGCLMVVYTLEVILLHERPPKKIMRRPPGGASW